MSDFKYFTTTKKGDIPELREELLSSDKKRKAAAMKRVVANMTMGNDMSSLFPDVLGCMQTPALDLKKMVYLYLVNYARPKQELALLTINSFIRDTEDPNPLIRGLAIRTMSYIEVDKISEAMAGPLRKLLKDQDPYVRKTAALCVGKLYKHEKQMVEDEGFLDSLKEMLNDSNTAVVANVLATLVEIDQDREGGIGISFDFTAVMKFLAALNECSEWAQVYIMEAISSYDPRESSEAEIIIERVAPRLNHANSGVILSAIKLIMHCSAYVTNEATKAAIPKKISPSLVTLLRSGAPEIQYVALRNILLIMQKIPDLFAKEMKVFFCEYNDPIYVKLTKLEVLMRIADPNNVEQILSELKEYSSEIDVDFVRKAVRAIGICAVKIERAADRCIEVLLELIQTKVNYVVQEAIVVIRNIFRKYPNRYESVIGALCENLDTLDEPDAKSAMIWIIGQYADRIDNADELLSTFLDSFLDEPSEVQLSLLTAIVKLVLNRPNTTQELLTKVLKWATEDVDNPDLRDRAFIYWRLISADPAAAKAIVMSEKLLSTEGSIENLEPNILNELLFYIGSLASIYHKPVSTFLEVKNKKVIPNLEVTSTHMESKATIASQQMNVSGNDFITPQVPSGMQASVAGGVGNVMNLLDLDLDEEPQYGGIETQTSTGIEESLGDLQISPGNPTSGITGLDFLSSGSSSQLAGGLFQTGHVRTKELILPAKSGQGLEIHGTFARRSGKIFLDLTFSNRAMQPLTDFAIQFNKNTFGLTPAANLEVRSPLMPNSSAETSLLLTFAAAQRAIKDPLPLLQIAFKNNVAIFYAQTNVHLHVLFPEDGGVERSEYLRLWREIPETNERTSLVQQLRFPNIEALRSKLSLNNIFIVAERQVEDRSLIYCSTSLLPDRQVFLLELTFDAGLQTCSAAVKTYSVEFSSFIEEALSGVLHSE